MDWRQRFLFLGGAGLGLAVGMAATHYAGEPRAVNKSPSLEALFAERPRVAPEEVGVTLPDFLADRPALQGTPVPGGAVVMNDPDMGEDPVHADAVVALPLGHQSKSLFPSTEFPPPQLQVAGARPITPPEPIGQPLRESPLAEAPPAGVRRELDGAPHAPLAAAPTTPPAAKLSPTVVELLGDELQGVSEQQLEVWADALQGLPPGDAAGIIRMWKNVAESAHPQATVSPFPSVSPPGATLPEMPLPNALTSPAPAPLAPDDGATKSEAWMMQINRHNMANAETCGYLNLIPVQVERPLELNSDTSMEVVGYRLDILPGRYVKTGNPSHVAVQRETFLAVRAEGGQELYTRVGRLVLDAERRLCVDLGDEDMPLVPEIKLPEAVTRFALRGDTVQIQGPGEAEPQTIGQLKVAEFFDASRLQPQGRCLYAATTASGTAHMVPAELIQETLEYPARMDGRGQRMAQE